MERSRYLAGLIGPVLIAVALTLLVNRAILPQIIETVGHNYILIMLSGFIVLPVGLAIVMGHNIWRGWPALITLIGWAAIIGGAIRLIFPAVLADIAGHVQGTGWPPLVASAVLAVGGAFLSFQAFSKKA